MKKVVIFLISFVIVISVSGCSVKKVKELTDSEKFAKEFNISENNPFVYASSNDILNILENGTGIIFFATSDDEGSIKAASYISDVAKSMNIQNINYYNPKKLEDKKDKKYKKMINYLNQEDEKFILPGVYAIKNGEIVCYSNYFSSEEELSEENLTKKKIKKVKSIYSKILKYEKCV